MRQRWQLAAGLLRAPYSIHDVRAFSGLANGCTVPEDLVAASQVKCDVPMWQLASWRSPPVEFHPAEAPPTALSWLRRRGPDVHDSVLHHAFRKRQVRVVEGGFGSTARRVARGDRLAPGAQILVPNSFLPAPPALPPGASRPKSETPAAAARRAAAVAACGEVLRRRVLHRDRHLLVLDKPAGLPVQGGPGRAVSLDEAMAEALRFGADDRPRLCGGTPNNTVLAPRLVHRLDRETSGAFVVARNAASAAWLSAAFARKSGAAAAAPAARGSGSAATPASAQGCIRKLPVSGSQDLPWISRSYWAVVEAGWALPATGAVSEPVVTKQDGRRIEQQALTHYRTLAQDHGLAWLELTPVTGRKHQLRLHCARALGCPILGDGQYGTCRSALQRSLPEFLRAAIQNSNTAAVASSAVLGSCDSISGVDSNVEADRSGSAAPKKAALHLHARSLTIGGGSSETAVVHVEAEPPSHMTHLLHALEWRQQPEQSLHRA